jgi:sulfur carrier protein
MLVTINGDPVNIEAGKSLKEFLVERGFQTTWVAVALDGKVLPRDAWSSTVIHEAAEIEVIAPMQGG